MSESRKVGGGKHVARPKFVPSRNFAFRFTKDQLEDFKRVFDLFDDDRDGYMSSSLLGTAMRAVGLLPNEREVKYILEEELGADFSETIDMGTFYVLLARKFRDNGEIERSTKFSMQQILSEKNLDDEDRHNKRIISLQNLQNVLSDQTGEPITEEEIDELLLHIPESILTKGGDANAQKLEHFLLKFDERNHHHKKKKKDRKDKKDKKEKKPHKHQHGEDDGSKQQGPHSHHRAHNASPTRSTRAIQMLVNEGEAGVDSKEEKSGLGEEPAVRPNPHPEPESESGPAAPIIDANDNEIVPRPSVTGLHMVNLSLQIDHSFVEDQEAFIRQEEESKAAVG